MLTANEIYKSQEIPAFCPYFILSADSGRCVRSIRQLSSYLETYFQSEGLQACLKMEAELLGNVCYRDVKWAESGLL